MARQLEQLPGMEDPADEYTVQRLVAFGFKREVVSLWPRSKAVTVLEARNKEANAVERKRNREEGRDEPSRRPVLDYERRDAADYLDRAKGLGEPQLALSYCVFALEDEEAARLAEFMAKKFRGVG